MYVSVSAIVGINCTPVLFFFHSFYFSARHRDLLWLFVSALRFLVSSISHMIQHYVLCKKLAFYIFLFVIYKE
jgi:hypothetical protein